MLDGEGEVVDFIKSFVEKMLVLFNLFIFFIEKEKRF